MSQKIVTEKLARISLYDLEGSLDSLIEKFQKLKEEHKDKEKLSLSLESRPYDDGQEYLLMCQRPENDKEREKRLADDTKMKEYRRQEYTRLKKEFENE